MATESGLQTLWTRVRVLLDSGEERELAVESCMPLADVVDPTKLMQQLYFPHGERVTVEVEGQSLVAEVAQIVSVEEGPERRLVFKAQLRFSVHACQQRLGHLLFDLEQISQAMFAVGDRVTVSAAAKNNTMGTWASADITRVLGRSYKVRLCQDGSSISVRHRDVMEHHDMSQ
jgi:antitoxin component of MazEF toxin-antitoxin module